LSYLDSLRLAYRAVRPLLFAADAETVHRATIHLGALISRSTTVCTGLSNLLSVRDSRLEVRLFGQTMPGPLGIAAGFDKNAELVGLLAALGFGAIEVGTVTPRPWGGNPRPRLFRLLEDEAIINRMGLNNHGAATAASRVRQAASAGVPVGINVGRVNDGSADAVDDYGEAIRQLGDAGNYIAINVSCPNTGDGRTFEEPRALRRLLDAVQAAAKKPWVVKFSPDLPMSELLSLVDVAMEAGAAGLILTNTTTSRDDLVTPRRQVDAIGTGGLSGRPLARRALAVLHAVYRYTQGRVPLIGVGGIMNADDVYLRMRAGASLVQCYSGLVYHGPSMAGDVHRALLERVERDGVRTVCDWVGVGAPGH
jgi:dihydroorotate dehydrogenase